MRTRLLVLIVGLGALAACATAPPPALAQARPDPAARQRDCLQNTGSHLKPAPGQCLAGAGRVIDADELRRSGTVDLNDAFRRLHVF